MHFTQASPLKRWAGTNIDATSFASKVPTLTEPVASSTVAVINLVDPLTDGELIPRGLKLLFILLGADNDVASFRFIGWNRIRVGQGSNPDTLWVPQPFAEFSCTASAAVGVAASPILNTERFCDTIAPVALKGEDRKIAAGTSVNSDVYVYTPADDTVGHVILPILGAYDKLEFTLDQTTNTPTGNVIYSLLR
jgi:hypothetical protein